MRTAGSGPTALLRSEGRFAPGAAAVPWRPLLLWLLAGTIVYGGTMGAFAGRPLQALYSGLKLPGLLLISTALCLPSFFVLNTVLGLRDHFARACRAIVATQATVALVLSGLAPLLVVVYLSTTSYRLAMAANGACFLLATLGGQVSASRAYRPLLAADRRHRIGLAAWTLLYVFVSIQMAWVLRPFVGDPDTATTFLRADAWSNAYMVVVELVVRLLGG